MKNSMFEWAISVCLMVSLLAGCSYGPQADYSKLGLVQVSGTVTLDGTPVAGAAVFFMEEDETYSFGVTDSNGRYTLQLNSEKSGVIPGEKRVEISTVRNPLGDAASTGEGGEEEDPDAKPASQSEQIPACYNSQSELRVTVTSSDSSMDFELKSDCSTKQAS